MPNTDFYRMQVCNRLYIRKLRLSLPFFLSLAFSLIGFSQAKSISKNDVSSTLLVDSITKNVNDSLASKPLVKKNPNAINEEIIYSAKDSIVFLGNGTGFLHGESDIKYQNIGLKADYVRIKMDSSLVFAKGKVDSLGKNIGEPVFDDSGTEYKSNELNYNLKTKKAYIKQVVTQQGEGYVISTKTKKTADDILCMSGGKYTTCENHEHPDFYLSLSKAKVKPGGYVVHGPAHLVVCDVPLPIAIPFGFFPFTSQYSSGVLMPTYADDMNQGFGLINGGYYLAINNYVDLELRADFYTKGSWGLAANSTYRKNYKYSGSFNVNYRINITGEKGMPDYGRAKNLSIRWSHTQDQKLNPFFNFSSSVNFSTSGYDRSNFNNYSRPELTSQNTKASSINFTKRFPESPFTISGSMNVAQQTRDSTIDLSLPNISISMSRIYPFKRKSVVGKERWYEKIAFSYSGTLANSIRTKEDKLLTSSLSRDWKNGMRHSIPISATFNLFKYINITPSVNYNERWYLQKFNQSWDKSAQNVITDTTSGFYRVYDFDMGVSASTKLYGNYTPLWGKSIERIRHVITPTIGFNYRPDFGADTWGYYDDYTKSVIDSKAPLGYRDEVVQYSHYNGSLYGTPGSGKSGSINFSLTNNVEMKMVNKMDTTGNEPYKKVSLIDNFSVSGGYNLAIDSMQWSMLNTNLRLKFGKSYSLNLSGSFDPYMYGLNANGDPVRINKLRWEHGKFPKFLGTSTSFSYQLSNETFKKKNKDKKNEKSGDADSGTKKNGVDNDLNNSKAGGENSDESSAEFDADGYQKSPLIWSLDFSYSIRYQELSGNANFNFDKMEYKMGFTHNLSMSARLSLTKNWDFNTSTSYDFEAKKIAYTSINVTRKLHCWTMTGSFVPFGPFKTYNFRLGVNASMLQDLKYDKRSGSGRTNITWY